MAPLDDEEKAEIPDELAAAADPPPRWKSAIAW
jgi:hypothetical protein